MSPSSAPLAYLTLTGAVLLGVVIASLVHLDRLPMDPALTLRRRLLTGAAAVGAGGVVLCLGLMTAVA